MGTTTHSVTPRPGPGALLRSRAAATGAALAGATALVGLVDPGVPGRFPTCPFLLLTGRPCPLCGGLRATHHLLHGDLLGSLSYNALTIPILLVATLWWGSWMWRTARGAPPPANPRPAVLLAGAAALAVFGILRNLPGLEFLAPPV